MMRSPFSLTERKCEKLSSCFRKRKKTSMSQCLREAFGCISDGGFSIVGAEQQTNGRVVVGLHHLMFVVVHIEVELRGVFMTEAVDLEVDDDVAFQDAVIKALK